MAKEKGWRQVQSCNNGLTLALYHKRRASVLVKEAKKVSQGMNQARRNKSKKGKKKWLQSKIEQSWHSMGNTRINIIEKKFHLIRLYLWQSLVSVLLLSCRLNELFGYIPNPQPLYFIPRTMTSFFFLWHAFSPKISLPLGLKNLHNTWRESLEKACGMDFRSGCHQQMVASKMKVVVLPRERM